jgi:type IV/VI secretion system ImpK/VasF family protein
MAGGTTSGQSAGRLSGQHQYQVLYEEVVRTKKEIVAALQTSASRQPTEPLTCEAAQHRIIDLVETQAGDALFLPENHEKRLSLYVIIAMADEVFLRSPDLSGGAGLPRWSGWSEWLQMPLEQRLFRSQCAGDRLYEHLDAVFSSRVNFSTELLNVFLTTLTLGFRGRYDDTTKPDEYRINLISVLERLLGTDGSGHAGDAAADANLFRHTAKVVQERPVLPSVMNGISPILAVIALWLVVGFVVWEYTTHDLSTALDAMLPVGQ